MWYANTVLCPIKHCWMWGRMQRCQSWRGIRQTKDAYRENMGMKIWRWLLSTQDRCGKVFGTSQWSQIQQTFSCGRILNILTSFLSVHKGATRGSHTTAPQRPHPHGGRAEWLLNDTYSHHRDMRWEKVQSRLKHPTLEIHQTQTQQVRRETIVTALHTTWTHLKRRTCTKLLFAGFDSPSN